MRERVLATDWSVYFSRLRLGRLPERRLRGQICGSCPRLSTKRGDTREQAAFALRLLAGRSRPTSSAVRSARVRPPGGLAES